MKPAKEKPWWLRSAWYRPPSLSYPAKTREQCEADARDYFAWLAKRRKWTLEQAEVYARSQDRRALLGGVGEGRGIQEDWLGDSCIRTVQCHTARAFEIEGGDSCRLPLEEEDRPDDWRAISRVRKGAGVTTYTVIHLGRYHDAFLSKARARACALALVEKERAFQAQVREAIALCEAA